jgi:phenylpropionate dioxygenase-like ring-hydroxylating dioxygenase large terminal subunit
MQRSDILALTQRLITQLENNSTEEAPEEIRESASAFLCPERHEQERQQFFLNTPQVIGFAGEIAKPGSYLTAEICGVPVLVTRTENNEVKAFVNACAHKGARVAHDRGEKSRLNCHFHGWSYGLDGELKGRPKASCFHTVDASCSLKSLPVSIGSSLIVVGLKHDMPQATVDNALSEIEGEFSGFNFNDVHHIETRRYEVNANWKLVTGLSHESYHFATVHRNSVAQMMAANAVFDTFGEHSRWAFAFKGLERLANEPQDNWPNYIEGAINHTLFPGTVIVKNPVDAQMIRVEPGGTPDKCIVYYTGACGDLGNLENAKAAYEFGGDVFKNEDLPVAEECQQGLAAAGNDFIIGRNEPIVQFWHTLWNNKLRDNQ